MKVQFDEDRTNRFVLQRCVVARERQGEVSAGDRAGRPAGRDRALPGVSSVLRDRQAPRTAAPKRPTGSRRSRTSGIKLSSGLS
jgi:hypothetical protein